MLLCRDQPVDLQVCGLSPLLSERSMPALAREPSLAEIASVAGTSPESRKRAWLTSRDQLPSQRLPQGLIAESAGWHGGSPWVHSDEGRVRHVEIRAGWDAATPSLVSGWNDAGKDFRPCSESVGYPGLSECGRSPPLLPHLDRDLARHCHMHKRSQSAASLHVEQILRTLTKCPATTDSGLPSVPHRSSCCVCNTFNLRSGAIRFK